MPHKAKPEHFTELDLVTTMAEAIRQYDVHRQTLTYAIDAGNLAAIRQGKIVLISRRSLENYIRTLRS
jgi:hypothetical protein